MPQIVGDDRINIKDALIAARDECQRLAALKEEDYEQQVLRAMFYDAVLEFLSPSPVVLERQRVGFLHSCLELFRQPHWYDQLRLEARDAAAYLNTCAG
jgi:hypothetical protein